MCVWLVTTLLDSVVDEKHSSGGQTFYISVITQFRVCVSNFGIDRMTMNSKNGHLTFSIRLPYSN